VLLRTWSSSLMHVDFPVRVFRFMCLRTAACALLVMVAGCGTPARERASAPAAASASAPAPEAAPAAGTARDSVPLPDPEPREIELAPGVRVRPALPTGEVEIDAIVVLDAGWLEQVACSPGTREHEALVVIEAPAHVVHAALLAAGFVPGRPGRWSYDEETGFQFVAPAGSPLRILVRRLDEGPEAYESINAWIIAEGDERTLPDDPFVFAGSAFAPAVSWDGSVGEEQYVADVTGSVIGLVTFGDEVIGYSRVYADQSDVAPQEWIADSSRVPPIGTPVVLLIRAYEKVAAPADPVR